MRKIFLFLLTLCLCGNALFAQDVDKKEKKKSKVGSFLRKVGEQTTGINMSDETYITVEETVTSGKVAKELKVEFVGCYGDSKSGEVYMVITMNYTGTSMPIWVDVIMAATSKGKIYKGSEESVKVDEIIRGQNTELNLDADRITGVPASLKAFETLKIEMSRGGWSDSYIFHNVPIQWDKSPEE